MNLTLSANLHQTIVAHVEGTYPNEGGGFLVGIQEPGQTVVTEIHSVQNVFATEAQFHRFLAEDGAFQRIEDEADTRGLSLIGYFHSHPNSPAVPSEFDRVHAWPYFAYLIVSVQQGQAAETLLWELVDDRSHFIQGNLIIKE